MFLVANNCSARKESDGFSIGLESGTDLQFSESKIKNKKIFIVLIFFLSENFAIEKKEKARHGLKKKRNELQISNSLTKQKNLYNKALSTFY